MWPVGCVFETPDLNELQMSLNVVAYKNLGAFVGGETRL